MVNNYERIQHASVRVKVDPKYVDLQRTLDEVWYGDMDENGRSDRSTGAKAGVTNRIWEGFNLSQGGVDLFHNLSVLIEAHRVEELANVNEADGNPYPDLNVQAGRPNEPDEDKRDLARARIAAEKGKGRDIDQIIIHIRGL